LRSRRMPHLTTDDGVKLFYEEVGSNLSIVFVHEFAGDCRSWEPQMRHFGRRYRCIAFNARGYPPSDVPDAAESYSQQRACDDIKAVVDALGIDKAHVVGLSMGGFAALHFGFAYAERARSLVVAGAGYGAKPDARAQFAAETDATARRFDELGMAAAAATYALGPARVQYQNKDPRGWREFADELAQPSSIGAAMTMRGVQARRPSLYDLKDRLSRMPVPTLIMVGGEDDHCLQPGIFLKRAIPAAGLAVLPKTGHTLNLEEPALFNQLVAEFIAAVEAGRWEPRDPRAVPAEIMKTS
jgi:pimeloyl-ACP methyl ester carboxylesterase